MTTDDTSIHFGQYLVLLNTLYPTIDGLIAFDRSGNRVWQQCPASPDEEQLAAFVAKLLNAAEDSHTHQLANGALAELVKRADPQGDPALMLCLLSGEGNPATMPRLAAQPAFIQVKIQAGALRMDTEFPGLKVVGRRRANGLRNQIIPIFVLKLRIFHGRFRP